MKKINVTKSYLPPIEEYIEKISKIWDNHHLTNYGPLNIEFVDKLEDFLKLKNLHYVNNGTLALHLALEASNLEECEIITTPFTFIATSSSIMWQRCKPVFVDIKATDFNIDEDLIEKSITKNTKAILAVHCFGFPCNIDKIDKIAKKHNLIVIYDAAHAFGVKINGKSLLSFGDISCCSLHATKVFHSVEGGLCICNNCTFNEKLEAIKNFGNLNGTYKYVGTNAKNSEFHAAMGLCVLDHINEIIEKRKKIHNLYVKYLKDNFDIPKLSNEVEHNYIYFPLLFKNEKELLSTFENLNRENIFPRRYFYPALNELEITNDNKIYPIAQDISKRIACLPMDSYLEEKDVKKICNIIVNSIQEG